jgi:hypothetical protein
LAAVETVALDKDFPDHEVLLEVVTAVVAVAVASL